MRLRLLASAGIIVFPLLLGCAALSIRNGDIIDDSAIITAVSVKIFEDPLLHFLKIAVESNQGNVVLTGFAPQRDVETRLIELTKQVRGVRSVSSRLKIEQQE